MTTATEKRIGTIIREHIRELNGTFDTRAVAVEVLAELSESQIQEVAVYGVMEKIRSTRSQMRPPVRVNGSTNGSARWDQVREARDILDDWWVAFTDRSGKHLLDCTAEDCADAAEYHRYQAETNAVRLAQYKKLAEKLRRSKARVVADLDRDEVRRLLDA